jgi:hypothetical protein
VDADGLPGTAERPISPAFEEIDGFWAMPIEADESFPEAGVKGNGGSGRTGFARRSALEAVNRANDSLVVATGGEGALCTAGGLIGLDSRSAEAVVNRAGDFFAEDRDSLVVDAGRGEDGNLGLERRSAVADVKRPGDFCADAEVEIGGFGEWDGVDLVGFETRSALVVVNSPGVFSVFIASAFGRCMAGGLQGLGWDRRSAVAAENFIGVDLDGGGVHSDFSMRYSKSGVDCDVFFPCAFCLCPEDGNGFLFPLLGPCGPFRLL